MEELKRQISTLLIAVQGNNLLLSAFQGEVSHPWKVSMA